MTRLGMLVCGVVVAGCKPGAPSTESPPATSTTAAATSVATPTPTPTPPDPALERVPEVEGGLPEVPSGALRVNVRGNAIEIGATKVASLESGEDLSSTEGDAFIQAMSTAGAANRPVAIAMDATVSASTVVVLVDAVQDSGATMVGLVARYDNGAGWIPVRAAMQGRDGVTELRLDADETNFVGVADGAWAGADGSHQLTVVVDADMKAQALFAALQTLRGPTCAEQPGSCRFSALELVASTYRAESPPGPGGLGLVGTGRGSGSGSGFGGRGKRVPRVRQAKATVSPGLDKDIIRRIVRAHINEVRHCYNNGLAKTPDLSGRVEVKFAISAKGKVSSAKVKSSTLSDSAVATCIAKAVKRWKFPKPQGGVTVDVLYPFVLEPG